MEIQKLTHEKHQYETELQTYRRQQIQYQQQIAESDALLRDLHSRESDSAEFLSAKDAQIALLRVRLAEFEELIQTKTLQYEQLHKEYSRTLQNSSDSSSPSSDFLQLRLTQLEQEFERTMKENERLNHENQQLVEQLRATEKHLHDEHLQFYEQQQQTKHAKTLIHIFF